MSNLAGRRELFIQGLVENAGWNREQAEEHFNTLAPMFEIGNEAEFVKSEAARLRNRYPKILVCPMMYKLEDNRLYLIPE
jgi:carbonic anhydrase